MECPQIVADAGTEGIIEASRAGRESGDLRVARWTGRMSLIVSLAASCRSAAAERSSSLRRARPNTGGHAAAIPRTDRLDLIFTTIRALGSSKSSCQRIASRSVAAREDRRSTSFAFSSTRPLRRLLWAASCHLLGVFVCLCDLQDLHSPPDDRLRPLRQRPLLVAPSSTSG